KTLQNAPEYEVSGRWQWRLKTFRGRFATKKRIAIRSYRVQICYGELDWPDEYSKRRFLRGEFLNAVAEYEPGVCEALYGEPLRLFGELGGYDPTLSWEDFAITTKPTGGDALIDSLIQWSRDWRLDADWCREAAYESLIRYCRASASDSLSNNQFHHRFDLPTRSGLDMTLDPPEGLE